MNLKVSKVERSIGGRTFSIETGKLAKQASGAVLVRYEDTVVLSTVVSADPRSGIDFFPLTVDYREKTAAAGKFPGGFSLDLRTSPWSPFEDTTDKSLSTRRCEEERRGNLLGLRCCAVSDCRGRLGSLAKTKSGGTSAFVGGIFEGGLEGIFRARVDVLEKDTEAAIGPPHPLRSSPIRRIDSQAWRQH